MDSGKPRKLDPDSEEWRQQSRELWSRLEENGVLTKVEAVRPFQHRFELLRNNGRIEQLLARLRIVEVSAEMTINDPEAGQVGGPRRQEAASDNSCAEEIGHLADGFVRGSEEGGANPQAAVVGPGAECD